MYIAQFDPELAVDPVSDGEVATYLAETDKGWDLYLDYVFSDIECIEKLCKVIGMTQKCGNLRNKEDFEKIGSALCVMVDDGLNKMAKEHYDELEEEAEKYTNRFLAD